jgi:hypothetical protein
MSSDPSGTELVIGVPMRGTPVPEKPFATTAGPLMQVAASAGTVAP